jgi:hypothetical protein
MAQFFNRCVKAGRMILSGIVGLLTGGQPYQADQVLDRKVGQSLSSLPVEILLHIQDHLPLSSAACLILCSRHMMAALGSQSLCSLKADGQARERRLLLITLQKDLPEWLLCYPCSRFHPVKPHEGPRDIWRYDREPTCVQENGVAYLTTDYRIRYQHAQLVMN